ncbi:unnamed protein product [Orchesella dallaii]|uniref:Trans-1,2-dihydrobenzene-1,2-diol dehydrogenase n=1 Tax=Orchesella dallaii TaxID=48710 RepID=A0ABP1S6J5_9HEXA
MTTITISTTDSIPHSLRWGIVSAGLISNDFVVAMTTLNPSEHVAAAVAARSVADAEKFAKEHDIPKFYGSYEELFQDPEIDVIYIGSIHPYHLPLAKQALDNGKPVLCEKPLCMNSKETTELIEYAKEKNLFLMEAIWVRHFPVYRKLKELLDQGAIGEAKNLIISFGIPIGDKDSCKYPNLGGGSTLGIGIYCVQLALFVFGQQKPEIVSTGCLNKWGADESGSTTLKFSGGRMATFTTSYNTLMPNEAFIVGTTGTIKMHSPFLSTTKLEVTPSGNVFHYSLPESAKSTILEGSTGLSYQCLEVRRCINEGRLESPVMSHWESQLIAEICESIRKQIGVVYPQD